MILNGIVCLGCW